MSIPKCKHGVFDPHQDGAYCQMCNPATNDNVARPADTPKFNRRGSLAMTETGKLPKCPNCGEHSLLTVSNKGCTICHTEFNIVSPEHLRANNKQPGVCPSCGCGIHFEVTAKTWRCADCDEVYKAPKRITG